MLSCEKETEDKPVVAELTNQKLFSVDLYPAGGDLAYYIAAYTPEGELLGYGSLADSSKWNLQAKYSGNKIDILYFYFLNNDELYIDHFRNIPIGQSFKYGYYRKNDKQNNIRQIGTSQSKEYIFRNNTPSQNMRHEYKSFVLKVEDFGNRTNNHTATCSYEEWPYQHERGVYMPNGRFTWSKVENGYTYKSITLDSDPMYQGFEISLFERGTNAPYIYYFNQPLTGYNTGDTITLQKSDFIKGALNTIKINAAGYASVSHVDLCTYNCENGKHDLITSFDNHIRADTVRHFSSQNLPINRWEFSFLSAGYITSYTISTNKPIPATIDTKELRGQKITEVDNQFELTHSNPIANSPTTRSNVVFMKYWGSSSIRYTIHFTGAESIGKTTIKPFAIPEGILIKHPEINDPTNAVKWKPYTYNQIHTNVPKNGPFDYLRYNLLMWEESKSTSTGVYAYETLSTYVSW